MRTSIRLLLLGAFAPLAALEAQTPESPWTPWFGCWAPAAGSPGPTTCIVPGQAAASADLLTVVDRAVTQRTTVVADGTGRPVTIPECTGWEAARFSLDGDRVYLSSEVSCGGAPRSTTSGVFSISRSGDWLDVHGVRVADQRNVRVRRASALEDLSLMPEEVRAALAPVTRVAGTSRIGASVPLSFDRVVDVAQSVDERVAEAWLVESSVDADTRLQVTAAGLVALEEAKVPSRVIDVVVALGYPQAFQIAMGPGGVGEVREAPAEQRIGSRPVGGTGGGAYFDPAFGYYGSRSWAGACAMPFNGYWGLSWYQAQRIACSGFDNMYGSAWYGGAWWGYQRPIVVVVRPQPPTNGTGGTPQPRGRVVNGGGYTQQTGTTSDNPAQPRFGTGSTGSTPVQSSGTAGSTKTGGSSSGTTTTRTAKPRDP